MANKPTREEAWTILTDHVKSPSLISHALAVEAVMRHIARKKSADEELWGVIGLIHDVDYEEHPDEHLRLRTGTSVVRGRHSSFPRTSFMADARLRIAFPPSPANEEPCMIAKVLGWSAASLAIWRSVVEL